MQNLKNLSVEVIEKAILKWAYTNRRRIVIVLFFCFSLLLFKDNFGLQSILDRRAVFIITFLIGLLVFKIKPQLIVIASIAILFIALIITLLDRPKLAEYAGDYFFILLTIAIIKSTIRTIFPRGINELGLKQK